MFLDFIHIQNDYTLCPASQLLPCKYVTGLVSIFGWQHAKVKSTKINPPLQRTRLFNFAFVTLPRVPYVQSGHVRGCFLGVKFNSKPLFFSRLWRKKCFVSDLGPTLGIIVKPSPEVPKSKVPKSRPKGLGLTLKSQKSASPEILIKPIYIKYNSNFVALLSLIAK